MKDRPRNGIYGHTVYDQWKTLKEHVDRFIPDECIGGHIRGNCSEMRAKAKVLELFAKALYETCKATLPDRK